MRLTEMNENIFDNLNEQSVYVMGFIWANGTLVDNNGYLRVIITNNNKGILEDVARTMKWKGTLFNDRGSYRLTFSNKKPINKLVDYGFIQRKSKLITYPKLPYALQHHFIRGYFDGNGHFSYEQYKKGKKRFVSGFTCGSEQFINSLCDVLHKQFGLRKAPIKFRSNGGGYRYDIKYYVRDTKKLYALIYKDATIYMKRKKNYADAFIK